MSSGKTFIAPTTGSDNVLFNSSHHKNEKDVLSGFTPNKAVITDTTGNILASSVGSAKLAFLSDVTDNIGGLLDTKAPINNPTFTGTVAGINKTMVGLGNVDNTSDADKPVSTAQQTALNAKQDTITNNSLTIANTSGLQSALDSKQASLSLFDEVDGYKTTISRSDGDRVALDVQGRLEVNAPTIANAHSASSVVEGAGFVSHVASTFNENVTVDATLQATNLTFGASSTNVETALNGKQDTLAGAVAGNNQTQLTVGKIGFFSDTYKITTLPSQLAIFGTNASGNGIGFYVDDGTGNAHLSNAVMQIQASGHVLIRDNHQLRFGDSADFKILHDGNDSIIRDSGTGDLKLETNGDHIEMRVTDSQDLMFRASKNGTNELYYSGVKRLETRVDGVNIINDLIAGSDGEIKISNISTGFGSETVSIQSYIDDKASGNDPDPFNVTDSRYIIALQPSHGRLTIGSETALGNAKVSINEQSGNTSANALMCIGGGNTGANGVVQITCINNGNNDKKQDGMAIKAVSNTNNIINFVNTSGGTRGVIDGVNSTEVSYNTTSDRRLKENIEDMDSQIDNIMSLRPVKYNWIENGEVSEGFIAQEVHNIYSRFKKDFKLNYCSDNENYDEDAPEDGLGNPYYYSLDYAKFTPYLVKCIQELKTMYDEKISALEERLAALENPV